MDDDVHGNGISVVKSSKVGDQVFFRFILVCVYCSCALSSHYPSLTTILLLSSFITLHLSHSLRSYSNPLSSPLSPISHLIPYPVLPCTTINAITPTQSQPRGQNLQRFPAFPVSAHNDLRGVWRPAEGRGRRKS